MSSLEGREGDSGDVRVQLVRGLGLAGRALDSAMPRMRDSVAPTVERFLLATPDPR